jgi:class 3 adenylate cyclase/TolB-like protein
MNQSERRLAAIMFTDIVGYSALTQRDEELSMELLREHNELLRAIFLRYGGTEIKTIGDAFHLEFPSTLQASQCAVEMQEALRKRNESEPTGRIIEIRIGIHVGDVVPDEGDIFGDAVNIAARIQSKADPGQTYISEDVYNQIHNKLDLSTFKLGRAELKNIKSPMAIYRLGTSEEGSEGLTAVRFRFLLARKKVRLSIALAVVLLFSGVGYMWATQDKSNRIAVLPVAMTNIVTDEAQLFLSGMRQSIIERLSKLEGLSVNARSSSMRYLDSEKDVLEIGNELAVDSILSLNALQAGERVNVTASLYDVKNDSIKNSESFDFEIGSFSLTETEIALMVADSLHISGATRTAVNKVMTENETALEAYYTALGYLAQGSETAIRNAIIQLQHAIDEDPQFAEAHGNLSLAYALDGRSQFYVLPSAEDALELEPRMAKAHTALAFNSWIFERDFVAAGRDFQKAIDLDPGDPLTHTLYSKMLTAHGEHRHAASELEIIQELEPGQASTLLLLSEASYYANNYLDALEKADEALLLLPNNSQAHAIRGLALLGQGDFSEAIGAFESALEKIKEMGHSISMDNLSVKSARLFEVLSLESVMMQYRAYIALAQANMGLVEVALEAIDDLKFYGGAHAYEIAAIYVALLDFDEAIKSLQRARINYPEFPLDLEYLNVDPRFDRMRANPQFIQFLAELGFGES